MALLFGFIMMSAAQAELRMAPLDYARVSPHGSGASLYVEGYLPNSCYGDPRAEVVRTEDDLEVRVVSVVKGEICAEVIRYFDLDVDLGEFEEGEHLLRLQSGSRWGSTLSFEIR